MASMVSYKMANVRDSDTSLWLHNKLGTSNDSWTGGSICTQLNAEVLKNIKDCFPDLQTQVKLKLLLSFFHIPRRNVEEWHGELEEIIEVAAVDSELWVSMLAEVLKTFPSTGSLNTEISEFDETRPIFSDMINELRKLVNKHADLGLLPLECHYLNKAALISVVGQQPNPVKHFTLKRKPKSVALRAELLQKSVDAQANLKKSVAPTVPVRSRGMPRKMTDTTPLKGLPSRWAQRGGGGTRVAPATRPAPLARPSPGGIKLLDIADQPATHQQIRKRRKLELEELQKKSSTTPTTPTTPTTTTTTPATSTPTTPTNPGASTATGAAPPLASPPTTLPEYARGLTTYAMPTAADGVIAAVSGASVVTTPTISSPAPINPSPTPIIVSGQPATPQPHAPKTPRLVTTALPVQLGKTPLQDTNPNPAVAQISTSNPPPLTATTNRQILLQPAGGSKPIILGQQQKLLITGQPGQKPLLVTAGPGGTLLSGQNILKTSTGVPVILSGSVLQHAAQNAQGQTILQQGGKTVVLTNVKQMPSLIQQSQPTGVILQNTTPAASATEQPVQAQTQAQPAGAQPAQQPGQQPTLMLRRGLALTREQMLEAQDMFRNANRVTRPEKALILGFMAGSRDNPCPHLGNIVTIKLSEDMENVLQSEDTYLTMLSEMHFQMNYNNGEWTRLKKYRAIDGMLPQKIPPGSTVITSANSQTAIVSVANQTPS